MNSKLLEKYSGLMNSLYDITKVTSNEELKVFCLQKLETFITDLYKKEKNNYEEYKNVLTNYGINSESLIEIKEENKDAENVKENEKFIEYKKELENIFNNPNEESIKVWLKNIVSYSNENNISDEKLNNFIYKTIEELDKDKKYINNIESYISEIKQNDIINENEIKEEKINNDVNSSESEEEKINNDVNPSEPEEENINNDINPTEPKEEIKEEPEQENIDTTKTTEKEEVEETKPLKILNIKKKINSPLTNAVLAAGALLTVGKFTNPLIMVGVGYIGYKLYKKKVNQAKDLINKCGLKLDNQNNLVDSEGRVITKESIGRLKYALVRSELEKIEKNNGKINKSFKKNRLASMLFSPIKKVVNRVKNPTYADLFSDKELEDINKGMRKI